MRSNIIFASGRKAGAYFGAHSGVTAWSRVGKISVALFDPRAAVASGDGNTAAGRGLFDVFVRIRFFEPGNKIFDAAVNKLRPHVPGQNDAERHQCNGDHIFEDRLALFVKKHAEPFCN